MNRARLCRARITTLSIASVAMLLKATTGRGNLVTVIASVSAMAGAMRAGSMTRQSPSVKAIASRSWSASGRETMPLDAEALMCQPLILASRLRIESITSTNTGAMPKIIADI
jgi:hypothetical protein